MGILGKFKIIYLRYHACACLNVISLNRIITEVHNLHLGDKLLNIGLHSLDGDMGRMDNAQCLFTQIFTHISSHSAAARGPLFDYQIGNAMCGHGKFNFHISTRRIERRIL